MWQEGLIEGYQSEMDDDDGVRDVDTNRVDGVMFPISMCVRELELR